MERKSGLLQRCRELTIGQIEAQREGGRRKALAYPFFLQRVCHGMLPKAEGKENRVEYKE